MELTPQAQGFMQLVKERTSHRGGYRKNVDVTDEQLQFILEAARWAPSAGNSQPWEFVVVRKPELRAAIIDIAKKQLKEKIEMEWVTRRTRKVGSDSGFVHAPVFIIIVGDPRTIEAYPVRTRLDKWQSHYFSSLSNTVLTIVLAAEAIGLGSQWLSDIASPYFATMVKALLGIPDPLQPYHLIPIGHVSRKLRPNPRRELDEMVHQDQYDMAKFRTDEQVREFFGQMGIRSPSYRW
ncbi:MAG TPA: nitroreductase family protein [Chloroflexota bacterium]|nr:nitroreductase family protein [Chloroflexota bacterium]